MSSEFRVPSSEFRVPSSEFRVPSSEFRVPNDAARRAFTLIELSIVLVIIGLIVGGVLVGQDLIQTARLRSQVSQIENLNTSVNVFRLKYNGLPGDLLSTQAAAFGLFSSNNGPARPWGDGNGILESGGGGCHAPGLTNCFYAELLMFFRHLSEANLINGTYASDSFVDANGALLATVSGGAINNLLPPAKIGKGTSIAVNSYQGINYFTIGAFLSLDAGNGYYGNPGANNNLTALEAFQIDTKMDDGKPNSGSVVAINLAGDISSTLWLWVTVSAVANCVTGGTDYNLTASTQACSLSIRMQ